MIVNKIQRGGDKVINFGLLAEKIAESGITITALASKCNMSRETYYNRMNGIGEFTASEIFAFTKVLHLSKEERDKIFFANKGE